MTTGLPDFFQYNLWANLRLLDACAHLSDAQLDATTKGTFGSVRETLMHLFASEEGYAGALTGTSPTPRLKELTTFPGFDELRRRAERSGEELITVAEQGDLSKILHLDGGTYDAPVIVRRYQLCSANRISSHPTLMAGHIMMPCTSRSREWLNFR